MSSHSVERHKILDHAFRSLLARSVANVQAAIEHIYPRVYEFRKPRAPKETNEEEEKLLQLIAEDSDDDEEDYENEQVLEEEEEDPLEPPPMKKQKVKDISHLTKKFKGRTGGKRPPGKTNEHSEDRMYVSDGDIDADDF